MLNTWCMVSGAFSISVVHKVGLSLNLDTKTIYSGFFLGLAMVDMYCYMTPVICASPDMCRMYVMGASHVRWAKVRLHFG
jgi:hypothetical protein